MDKLLLDMYEHSYLSARYETVRSDSLEMVVRLFTGKPLHWATLRPGNVDEGWLSQVGYRDKVFRNKPFNYLQVKGLMEKLLVYAENNGYPFARIQLNLYPVAVLVQGTETRAPRLR